MLYLGLFFVVMPIVPFTVYIKIFKIVNQSRKNRRSKNSSSSTNSLELEMQKSRSLQILANETGNLTVLARAIKVHAIVLFEKKIKVLVIKFSVKVKTRIGKVRWQNGRYSSKISVLKCLVLA